MNTLRRRTRRLFAFRKGILALDTAPAALVSRFRSASLSLTPRTTDEYLTMLLGTPDLSSATSAAVLDPQAFEAPRMRGRRMPEALRDAGILPGVRADTGVEPMSSDKRELVTSGLDGLATRLRRLRSAGATFAVWSTVAGTGADRGALRQLTANSQAAARFAYVCQDMGLVPLVRVGTRLGMDPGPPRDATLAAALLSISGHLEDLDVDLSAVVICVEAGPGTGRDPLVASPLAALPTRLGGVALAGGRQSATETVDAVATVCASAPPWPVTFYLGRHVTQPALHAWRGREASVRAAQRVLHAGLAAASAALCGQSNPDVPSGHELPGIARLGTATIR
ncbi:class I fructose-bisphosphate aldolase [Pseudonocardia hispaniensis]|uniref:fructose-bisphosphate aldolase n=1 Tax=Pseudonocardia hispaniensis TaxID=904933 RepID=A0ABW1J2B9_9PSEU